MSPNALIIRSQNLVPIFAKTPSVGVSEALTPLKGNALLSGYVGPISAEIAFHGFDHKVDDMT